MTQAPSPVPPAAPQPDDAAADLFDYQAIRLWLGFTFRGVKRHKVIAASVLAACLLFTSVVAQYAPRKYRSASRLLAQRNQLMSSLGNPGRNQFDYEGPTRAAYETVMARENLVNMIKQTKLVDHWKATRNPVLKLKDSAIQLFTGPPSPEIELDSMVGVLEKRLFVNADQSTIDIQVYWPDPQMARQLVDSAQQSFLEARHISEVSAISEVISILEMHLAETQTQIERVVADVQRVVDVKRKGGRPSPRPAPETRPKQSGETPAAASAQELAQIKFMIRSKRRAYTDLEEYRQRRLTELQAQLAEQRVIYSANHPVIQDIEQRIGALQKESPQITQLKRDIEALEAEYKSAGGNETADGPTQPRASVSVVDATLRELTPDLQDDPEIQVVRDQLRMAVARYQELQMRLDAARIELDTTRAAFKYRYTVVSPAQTPRRADSPNVALLIVAGVVLSVLMSIIGTLLFDLWRRRFVESWQVEKKLKLAVLADVKLS